MALPEISNPPELDIVQNLSDEYKKGVGGKTYVDAYNQAQMAKYNNEYNYWLWLQQMEYNSPSNQVQRLKEAGLNPNFNSIDGTGNMSSIPASSGSITPSIAKNKASQVQNIVSLANLAIGGVSTGVKALSTLKDVPPLTQLGDYRRIVKKMAGAVLRGKELDNFDKTLDSIVDIMLAGGNINGYTTDEDGNKVFKPFEISAPFTSGESVYFDGTKGSLGNIVIDPNQSSSIDYAQQKADAMGLDVKIKSAIEYVKRQSQDYDIESSKGKAGVSIGYQIIRDIADGKAFTMRELIMAVALLGLARLH